MTRMLCAYLPNDQQSTDGPECRSTTSKAVICASWICEDSSYHYQIDTIGRQLWYSAEMTITRQR